MLQRELKYTNTARAHTHTHTQRERERENTHKHKDRVNSELKQYKRIPNFSFS